MEPSLAPPRPERPLRRSARLVVLGILTLAALPATGAPQAAPEKPARRVLVVPADAADVNLEAREKAQLETLADVDANYFFRFTDRREESGITWRHRVVDDAGKHYKAVHYDHGSGVAAADVDGDGRTDLYFATQLGANGLWRNTGGGHFEDITDRAGVGLADVISVAPSFADYDNDGDPDLFVSTVKMGNHLFQNDGKGNFHDVTAAVGLSYTGHSSGSVWLDYDNDGWLDLFLTNVGTYTTAQKGSGGYFVGVEGAFSGHLFPERTEPSILYRNLGNGRFEDVSQRTGLVDTGWSGDAAAADLTGDGLPDLYVLNMQGDDHFWINDGHGHFREETAEHFPKTPWGSMGIKVFDYNHDRKPDLILTDMHSDMSENIGPEREKLKSNMKWSKETLQGGDNNIFGNAFYENEGGGRFSEVSDRLGTENYWPWGVSVDDINADGWDDVLITASMNYPFRYGINSLLLNDLGRRFADAELVLGVEPRATLVGDWFDLDCAGADRENQNCEGQDGPVTVRAALGSRSSVIFDLDGDGDLDIVTNEFNSAPQVLVSDLAQEGPVHWAAVELRGKRSNRDGLGARVTLVLPGGKSLTKVYDGKSGYLAWSSLPLYFGLGDAKRVERVEVDWPSGIHQVVAGPLAADRRIDVGEEASPAGERPDTGDDGEVAADEPAAAPGGA